MHIRVILYGVLHRLSLFNQARSYSFNLQFPPSAKLFLIISKS